MQQYKPGERIGGEYTVLKVLDSGKQTGMGIVYLVENREIPEPIVLKAFQRTDSEEAKFQIFSKAHAWIDTGVHANIVRAYWVREIGGQLFVAAEYVKPDGEGRNNLNYYLNIGNLCLETIIMWAVQFCRGMDYARSRGVLAHRGIKPDNLMIDGTATLKITDFGMGKTIDIDTMPRKRGQWLFRKKQAADTISKTKTYSILGTLPYMAPEQFIDAKDIDHRADIYSFGIILYQMVAGNRYPYRIRPESTNIESEYFWAHSEQTPLPVESVLMPVISRCLEKEPHRRYATYDAFLADLRDVAGKLRIDIPQVMPAAEEDNFKLTRMAKFYFEKKKARECLDCCNKLLQREHEPLLAISLKACVLNFIGGYEQALTFLQPYIDNNPDNDTLWVVLSKIHEYRENYDAAIKALHNAKCVLERGTGQHIADNLRLVDDKMRQLSEMR
jgi:serine/threonine protein kinase